MNIKIIDNFLDQKDLEEITSITLKIISNNEVKVYHNQIDKNNKIKNDCLNSEFLKRLQKNYHNKAMNLLKELNPEKTKLYDYSEFHIIETGAITIPIHDDTPDKLLSGVVYLKLKKFRTIFYKNKKGEGKNSIDWKVNRVFFKN